jgi:hypothetical protein
MTEWQPIETAPKDGTIIDLWAEGQRHTDCEWGQLDWEISYWGWPKDSVGWCEWSERYSCNGHVGNATHWMPIPKAPNITTGDQ